MLIRITDKIVSGSLWYTARLRMMISTITTWQLLKFSVIMADDFRLISGHKMH